MEFSFNIPDWFMVAIDNPAYVVIWAAFGMPVMILGLVIFFSCLKNLSTWGNKQRGPLLMLIFFPLIITWPMGFVVTMILLFAEIGTIKMMLIWLAILICSFVFFLVNQKVVSGYIDEVSKKA